MKLNRLLALFAVVLLAGLPAFAQTTANLTGTVTQAGNSLPGVTVTIASPNLQGTRTTVTDQNGNYNFGNLPPGDYSIKLEMEGMSPVSRTVQVSLSGTSRGDAEMKLSTVTTAITVTASAPAVLETTEIQTNIRQDLVEKLPLSRTLLGTVNLAPGTTTNGPGGATMISGAPSYDNTFYVDGSVINEVLRGQPNNLFIEDALQETTVQTGAISAEYGRFTGGVVTAISKSGGNSFSGSFRDSLTNPSWTAKTPLGETRAASSIQPTYEGTFGGRIIQDRLWFFTAGRYRKRDTQNFLFNSSPSVPYVFSDKERRLEGKLTGQVTPKHSLVLSYIDIKRDQVNNCFGNCYELSALDTPRSLPNKFATIDYNGVVTNSFLLEAAYSRQTFKFVGGGGPNTGDPATSTNIQVAGSGNLLGFPTFCGSCSSPEQRNNRYGKAKATYFLSSKSLGTQSISGGYEEYADEIKANNFQSGSSFTIYTFTEPTVTNNVVHPDITPGGALIVWWPILQLTKGDQFKTQSLFINDKWDYNQHLSFNLGARYDKNTGVNEARAKVADDKLVSPRIGAIYDVFGNGRLRFNGSYSKYASKIANGNVGDGTSPAGSPSILYWVYYGPDTTGQTSAQALKTMFNWFNSAAVGGINNKDFFAGGGTAGLSTQILGTLKTPSVTEYSGGVGGNITNNFFVRGDVQYRKWKDFYESITTQATGTIFDPLAGQKVDLGYITNGNDLTRTYRALIVQAGYHPFARVNVGGNYTWSKLRGNVTGETGGSGPVPSGASSTVYPEFTNFAQNNPVGYVGADQRSKLRAWVSYDLPVARIGSFTFSLLERYDSATPYSLVGKIDSRKSARCPSCPDPASTTYLNPPTTVNYFFSQRGQFRFDNINQTDVSVNYFLPISRATFFIESQMLNTFDKHGRVSFNTTVLTANTSSCHQTTGANAGKRCAGFNPFTDTPVEGINWVKGPNFGKALNPTNLFTGGDYQLPRTYRVSFGVKF
jgi:hypothetical protein